MAIASISTRHPASAAKSHVRSLAAALQRARRSKGRAPASYPRRGDEVQEAKIVAEVPEDVAYQAPALVPRISCRVSMPIEWDLFVTEGGEKGRETLTGSNHQGHSAIARRPYDAPHQFRHSAGDLLSRGASRGLRDGQGSPRARLEQDHPHLCWTSHRPAGQPGLQQVCFSTEKLQASSEAATKPNRKKEPT